MLQDKARQEKTAKVFFIIVVVTAVGIACSGCSSNVGAYGDQPGQGSLPWNNPTDWEQRTYGTR